MAKNAVIALLLMVTLQDQQMGNAPEKGMYASPQFDYSELRLQQNIHYASVPNFERIQYTSDVRKEKERGSVELDLHLDLISPPEEGAGSAHPLVVIVHGGAFSGGAKDYRHDLAKSYASHGYVTGTINYRLTPLFFQDMQPANRIMAVAHAVEDMMNAIRFLKLNAEKHGIDTARIALIGLSAGGIAAMINAVEYDSFMQVKNVFTGISSKVAAVVSSGASLYVHPSLDPTLFLKPKKEMTPVLLFHARPVDSTVGTTWEGHATKTCKLIDEHGGKCKAVPQPHLTHVSDMSASGLHWEEIKKFLWEELRLGR